MGEVPVMEEDKTRREASVLRYREKRQSRLFSKRIRYQVRKLNADKRPRLKVCCLIFFTPPIFWTSTNLILLIRIQFFWTHNSLYTKLLKDGKKEKKRKEKKIIFQSVFNMSKFMLVIYNLISTIFDNWV